MVSISSSTLPTVSRGAASVTEREVSATDLLYDHRGRIERDDPSVRAFITLCWDQARAAADAVDEKVAIGNDPGLLAGVPVAVKDNICTRGVRTTCGSRILGEWTPPYDATAVARLREAGAVLVGKTNLDEFGMGSSTEHSAFGASRNPYDLSRVPGGSSGGSAAAVAAGFVLGALGSDTGGSVRQPAAFCGLVGVKPTYGRVSRYGLVAYASSLDQIGCLTRSVDDAALMLDVISGFDALDSTSIPTPVRPIATGLAADVAGLRIGILGELTAEGVAADILAGLSGAAEALERGGALVEPVAVPAVAYGLSAYYLIATAEASSNLARFDGVRYGHRSEGTTAEEMMVRTRTDGFGDEVKRRIMLGTYALSAGYYDQYYEKARRVRTLICRDLAAVYASYDVLLAPTYPTTAFWLGEKLADPLTMYLGDICTVSSNMAGHPAMSVPFGSDANGLPVGIQVLAPALAENVMFRVALAIEEAAPPLRPPEIPLVAT